MTFIEEINQNNGDWNQITAKRNNIYTTAWLQTLAKRIHRQTTTTGATIVPFALLATWDSTFRNYF
jgi:hypothetical protein